MSTIESHQRLLAPLDRRTFMAIAAAAAILAMADEFSPTQAVVALHDRGSGRCSGRTNHLASTRRGRHWVKPDAGISPAAYRRARQRAVALVARMTLAEKIGQTGANAPAIERLGVPSYPYYSGEALHGLCRSAPVTAFPCPAALGCTWNPELLFQVFTAVSDEARAYHQRDGTGLSFYSPPTLNITRDPRWGRCEEVYGEDPCHVGTLATATVKGMQGTNANYLKTTACAKHFICNGTEDDRTTVSATVDPRSFWEYYTRSFRAAVIEGGVFSVMGAYNALNGVPCCADHFLLTRLLRRRWGFRGYVTSDCDAIALIDQGHHYVPTLHQAAALALQAGCDLNCGDTLPEHLGEAVRLNLVSAADISRAVERLLTARFLLGLFDPPALVPYNSIDFTVVNSPRHQALALEAAHQSIVLLKNERSFLPINPAGLTKVAVIGPLAGFHLGGYSGAPSIRISPLDGITTALGGTIHHTHISAADAVRFSAGIQTQASTETVGGGVDMGWITNGSWAEFAPQDFTGKNEIVCRVASYMQSGTAGEIEVHLDRLNGPLAATLQVPGTNGWQNWTSVSAGLRGITGQHKVWLKYLGGAGDLFNVEWFQLLPLSAPPPPPPGRPQVVYTPGCTILGPQDAKLFQQAVVTAKQADLVILICGVNQAVDCEGQDRQHLGLPGAQPELIQAVYAANPKTVLVLHTNNSVGVSWANRHLPAIVCSFFGGQAQGIAIADVLFGRYNPTGRLPTTWFQSVGQLPPFHDYDIRKGRTYLYFEGQPLYPFGHGLSYSAFHYSDLQIDAPSLAAGGRVGVSFRLANRSARAGAEVAQLYVVAPRSPVKRPRQELVGFKRVELQSGEIKTITFHLPYTAQALWYWHEGRRKFVLQPGTLKLLIGSSAADIHLRGQVRLEPCRQPHLGDFRTLDCNAVPAEVS